MNTPIPQGFELKEKVQSLQNALLDRHPRMATLLQEIHKTLKTYPENVTLLEPEEILIIVKGLESQTGVELAKSVVSKSASKSSKSLAAKLANLGDEL